MKRASRWALALIGTGLFVLILTGIQRDLEPADLRARYTNSASKFIDVGGGLLVHVRDEGKGDGPILVLLHGSNASLQTWEPWVKRLGMKYRVISLDQIGHGLTGPNPSDDYSMSAFVETLDKALTKIGVEHFVLAGNSMGGSVALNYALAHPDKVNVLVLVDSGGAPEVKTASLPIGFRIAMMPGVNRIAEIVTPRFLVERSLQQSLSNLSVIDDRMIDRYWELLLYPGNRRATMLRFSAKRTPVDPLALEKLTMPILILWGAEDKLIPVASAHWLAKATPRSKLVVYPGIGHAPMEEAADQSAGDVDAFLSGLAVPSQK